MTESAYAKINLALDVLGRREDGYHDLRMVMQTVSLCDTLTIRPSPPPHSLSVRIESQWASLPEDGDNLAMAAVELFLARVGKTDAFFALDLIKRIPVCAGLGGGSADAAAALRAMRALLAPDLPAETLLEWALELGSDVPYCLRGGTRLAEGRGEALTPVAPLPDCHIVLCKPPVAVSTRDAFAHLDKTGIHGRPDIPGLCAALGRGDLREAARYMYNVFEEPAAKAHRVLPEIRAELTRHGALGVVMSGSGPTMLALFDSEGRARDAHRALKARFEETFLCAPVSFSFASL